ncbi:hypothetical protein Y032_0033g2665 [Ancylostoma ceylanicum]|uniref:Uncharacterized protein n=1 Tax=Ancylostoma ceylanicum TaxID=53326 RepID=A0A016UNJ1_9BILA|nr:hypothetical protein Y032_0033g2665 [Ancylostoma ceylanicum]
MKSRKRSSSGKLGAKRALEKEAKILVPWSLDLDDDASSSDLEQGTKALNISAPANSLEEEGESNSEKSDGEMESKDTDEEDATVNADKESFLDSEEEENMEVADVPSSSKDDDYQKEFKVLGQTEFEPLNKIKIVYMITFEAAEKSPFLITYSEGASGRSRGGTKAPSHRLLRNGLSKAGFFFGISERNHIYHSNPQSLETLLM